MECGVPFCHNGCPLGNLIPDWNDLVYRDRWAGGDRAAAPHEQLPGVHRAALPRAVRGGVRARDQRGRRRLDQADRARDRQSRLGRRLDRAAARATRTGRSVAVVGSGPAGSPARSSSRGPASTSSSTSATRRRAGSSASACRTSRSRSGSSSGGCSSSSPRASSSASASTSAATSTSAELRADYDAVVLATGSRVPRDLPVPGRELAGVHFAMEYLYERARVIAGTATATISAAGKHVVVIGGGDTGADCVGNAHREGAASVTQIELLGEPPAVASRRPDAVAALADEAAHLVRAQGGRRAVVLDLDDALRRTCRRPRRADPLAAEHGRAAVRARSRAPRSRGRPSSCCSRWASSGPRPSCSTSSASSATRAATSRRPASRAHCRRCLRGGRRAPRPVADRVGDQRGPALCPGGRRLARRRDGRTERDTLFFR